MSRRSNSARSSRISSRQREWSTFVVHANNMRMEIPISTHLFNYGVSWTLEPQGTSTMRVFTLTRRVPEMPQPASPTARRTTTSSSTASSPMIDAGLEPTLGERSSTPPPRRSSSPELNPITRGTGFYPTIESSPTFGRSTIFGAPIPQSGQPLEYPSLWSTGFRPASTIHDRRDQGRSTLSVPAAPVKPAGRDR